MEQRLVIKETCKKRFEIVVEKIKEYCKNQGLNTIDIDGVRVELNDGWALVRYSNTGPNITARFEANTEERLEELKKEFIDLIEKYNV